MRICLLCMSPRVRDADAMLRAGSTQAAVARFVGLDRQVIGKHVRNGHIGPEPKRLVWEYSAEELRAHEAVDREFLAAVAAMSRLPVSRLRACYDKPLPQGHPADCEACAAIAANDAVWDAIDARVKAATRPAPGHWVEA